MLCRVKINAPKKQVHERWIETRLELQETYTWSTILGVSSLRILPVDAECSLKTGIQIYAYADAVDIYFFDCLIIVCYYV